MEQAKEAQHSNTASAEIAALKKHIDARYAGRLVPIWYEGYVSVLLNALNVSKCRDKQFLSLKDKVQRMAVCKLGELNIFSPLVNITATYKELSGNSLLGTGLG